MVSRLNYTDNHGGTDGTFSEIYRTEVIDNNLNPQWRSFNIPINRLCDITASSPAPENDRDNNNSKLPRVDEDDLRKSVMKKAQIKKNRKRIKDDNNNNNNTSIENTENPPASSGFQINTESLLFIECFDYDKVGSCDLIGSCKVIPIRITRYLIIFQCLTSLSENDHY